MNNSLNVDFSERTTGGRISSCPTIVTMITGDLAFSPGSSLKISLECESLCVITSSFFFFLVEVMCIFIRVNWTYIVVFPPEFRNFVLLYRCMCLFMFFFFFPTYRLF